MRYREIKQIDLEKCAELYSKVFSSEPWNEPWDIEIAFKRLSHFYESKGFIGILAEDENVMGLVLGNYEPFHKGDVFYLREMCVDTTQQRSGIGEELLNKLERVLNKESIKSMYLATEKDIPAASFYKKNGFREYGQMGIFTKEVNL